ncbi:MAG: tRNA uridine-5-carboxymethylaminomethyl(34) synthesis GTPase MnmE [bacterium]
MDWEEDTIAAISTPHGTGGLAVVRVSGSQAISIVDKLFQGKVRLAVAKSHNALLGKVVSPSHEKKQTQADFWDEVVVVVFRAPKSYTREDVVEISCHGGQLISQRILELLLDQGARLARPGEFTQRAFLNGRLDLSQAEAVADMIRAKTDLSLRAAQSQFQGALSSHVQTMRQNLIDLCSLLELELDFAEEDVEFADRQEVEERLREAINQIKDLVSTYQRGRILREGVKLVIVGKPNVGKSSLLNALLQEERAIVTEVPGTTRDVLEEQLDIDGVYFRVVDTAGVRDAGDMVEREGVRRTLDQIKGADVLLLLFDGSEPLDARDCKLVKRVRRLRAQESSNTDGFLAAINKIDLERRLDKDLLREHLGPVPILEISAKQRLGFKNLEKKLIALSLGGETASWTEALISNLRQKKALTQALDCLQRAREALTRGLSSEFVAVDLRAALDSLGEVIGEVTSEDILGNIFSKFCVGK